MLEEDAFDFDVAPLGDPDPEPAPAPEPVPFTVEIEEHADGSATYRFRFDPAYLEERAAEAAALTAEPLRLEGVFDAAGVLRDMMTNIQKIAVALQLSELAVRLTLPPEVDPADDPMFDFVLSADLDDLTDAEFDALVQAVGLNLEMPLDPDPEPLTNTFEPVDSCVPDDGMILTFTGLE